MIEVALHVKKRLSGLKKEGNLSRAVQCLEDLFICTEWSALAATSVSFPSNVISWSAGTSLSLGVVGLEAQLLSV